MFPKAGLDTGAISSFNFAPAQAGQVVRGSALDESRKAGTCKAGFSSKYLTLSKARQRLWADGIKIPNLYKALAVRRKQFDAMLKRYWFIVYL